MSKVDFYILPTDSLSARLDFACKLCEKAWRLGHRVYLNCSDAAQRDEDAGRGNRLDLGGQERPAGGDLLGQRLVGGRQAAHRVVYNPNKLSSIMTSA